MSVFVSVVAKVYLEGVVEDGNAGMEEAGVCSKEDRNCEQGERPAAGTSHKRTTVDPPPQCYTELPRSVELLHFPASSETFIMLAAKTKIYI